MSLPKHFQAYDFSVAAEFHASARQEKEEHRQKEIENKLDDELGDYWKQGPSYDSEEDMESKADRKEDAICAGKKRSVKERLGTRKSSHKHRNKFEDKYGDNVPKVYQ